MSTQDLILYAPSTHQTTPFPPKSQSQAQAALTHALRAFLAPPTPPATPTDPSFTHQSLNGTNPSDDHPSHSDSSTIVVPEPSHLTLDTSIADLTKEPRAHFDLSTKLFLPTCFASSATPRSLEPLVLDALARLKTLVRHDVQPDTFVVSWPEIQYAGEETDYSFGSKRTSTLSPTTPKTTERDSATEKLPSPPVDGEEEGAATKPGCGSLKLAGRDEAMREKKEEEEAFKRLHEGVSADVLETLAKEWTVRSIFPLLSVSIWFGPVLVLGIFVRCEERNELRRRSMRTIDKRIESLLLLSCLSYLPPLFYFFLLSFLPFFFFFFFFFLLQDLSSITALSSSTLGLTSFSEPLLRHFLSTLDKSTSSASPIRLPQINQLTLQDCCHIPQQLSNYARENDISLLSSDDPAGEWRTS